MKYKKNYKKRGAGVYAQFLNEVDGTFFEVVRLDEPVSSCPSLLKEVHSHNFYLIMWCTRAQGMCTIEFNDYELQDNTVYLLSPNQLHLFLGQGVCEGFCIAFTEDFLYMDNRDVEYAFKHDMFVQYDTARFCHVSEALGERLNRLVELMAEEQQRNEEADVFAHREMLGALLHQFLIEVKRHAEWNRDVEKEGPQDREQYKLFLSFMDCVEQHFCKEHGVYFYCSKLGVPVHQLVQCVNAYLKMPPKEAILSQIASEAKRQLCTTGKTVKQIGADLGFADVSHFCRVFRHIENMSPSDYRVLHQSECRQIENGAC